MSRRTERLQDQIRSDLSDLLRREVTDPRLASDAIVSITEVELTADLRHARVYISILGTAEQVHESFAAIKHATGFLRHVPELTFYLDQSVERGARVLELLKQVQEQNDG